MSRPFVDDNEHYYPEAIAMFIFLVLLGFIMGIAAGCAYILWS
jgi:hypothetical protein